MTDVRRRASHERLTYFARVFWIDHELRAHRYPNARTIAERFEVTTKTAQRTLDFMRDQLRLPLGYSGARRGWFYTEPAYALPAIEVTEGELVGILLVEKLSRQYRGTALGRQVEEAFAKVLSAMTGTVSVDLAALAEAHSFEAAPASALDPDLFRSLGRAAIDRRRVEMTYFTAARGELTRRTCDPLHLRNHLGEWYLIAFDHMRGEVRDFMASRIRELSVTEEIFEWPTDFDLTAYLDSGFVMFRGSQPYVVEIEFDEYQARWLRERSAFHPTEQREELPDGRLRLRMFVTALDGVKRFVMQYGAHAQVLAPEELRTEIREELTRSLKLYEELYSHKTQSGSSITATLGHRRTGGKAIIPRLILSEARWISDWRASRRVLSRLGLH